MGRWRFGQLGAGWESVNQDNPPARAGIMHAHVPDERLPLGTDGEMILGRRDVTETECLRDRTSGRGNP